ncbi:MAG: kinase/pyrophosphorylase [Alphaproteobacteria bacterium]|nr:kinase/pyrophosphorylase [Alphaproteobacteria bacterium]
MPQNSSESGRLGPRKFHIHLVSDASGSTLLGISRAVLAQFAGIEPHQKFWPLVRTDRQLERVISKIIEKPGPVIFTLISDNMRNRLIEVCEDLEVPYIPVLAPIINSLSAYLGLPAAGVPGLQHTMDKEYFKRVEAMEFAIRYDDGRTYEGLKKARVILVGVSRTSKTPTSVYLARSGVRTANMPLVPGIDVPEEYLTLKKPLYVGLTASPAHLRALRHNRISTGENHSAIIDENRYIGEEEIKEEVRNARRLFAKYNWPVIDVTRRSIEETAAEILSLLQSLQEKRKKEGRAQNGGD